MILSKSGLLRRGVSFYLFNRDKDHIKIRFAAKSIISNLLLDCCSEYILLESSKIERRNI